MKIEIVDTKAYIYTPYNAEFVKAIKGIGGARWNRDKSAWAIPADCADQAREIMRRVYGEDDRPDCGERVDVRLTFDSSVSEWQSAVTIYGKTISRAYGRDSGARCGDDVAFVEGQPESGGSVKKLDERSTAGQYRCTAQCARNAVRSAPAEGCQGGALRRAEEQPRCVDGRKTAPVGAHCRN